MRRQPARDLRQAVMTAGRELLDQDAAAALTPRRICSRAKVTAAQFTRHFPAENAFLCALMQLLLDEVRETLTKITYNMPPGLPRMKLAIECYLSANLQRPELRRLVHELRGDAQAADILHRRVVGFMLMMELELKSLRWPRPTATARLLTAALIEVLQLEHDAGRPLSQVRGLVFSYLDSRIA